MNKNQKIRAAVRALATVDKVMVKRDGTVEVRYGFFYRHGNTAEKLAEKVEKDLAGVSVKDMGERWQAWPKDSYWWVILEVNDLEVLLGKADEAIKKAGCTWEEVLKELAYS